MREVLFRGRVGKKGAWRFGDLLFREHDLPYIRVRRGGTQFQVNPETVGQYTGLKDKNGTRIFEGDIVIGLDANPFAVEFVENEYWCAFCVVERGLENGDCWMLNEFSTGNGFLRCEVIGNIHDNPELIGGE